MGTKVLDNVLYSPPCEAIVGDVGTYPHSSLAGSSELDGYQIHDGRRVDGPAALTDDSEPASVSGPGLRSLNERSIGRLQTRSRQATRARGANE